MSLPGNERAFVHANHWVDEDARHAMKARIIEPGASVFAKIGEGLKAERVRKVIRPTLIDNNLMAAVAVPNVIQPDYLFFLLQVVGLADLAGGSALPYLRQSDLERVPVSLPPLDVQGEIAGVLGALDDLIDTNQRLTDDLLTLGVALTKIEAVDSPRRCLGDLTVSIARGVTPQYSDDPDAVMVLNQKCIRDQRVSVSPARNMRPKIVKEEKIAKSGDTLVNSTGVGTLGRVARWIASEAVNVDSHVSVVKANPAVCQSAVLAYLLLSEQAGIEALAEGSTGQTELSRQRLAGLEVPLLSGEVQVELGERLDLLDTLRWELSREQQDLRRARDELLPLLLSGRVLPGEVAV